MKLKGINRLFLLSVLLGFICAFSFSSYAFAEDNNLGTWTTKASMSKARSGVRVTTLSGKIYAIGGCYAGDVLNTVEEYNPVTDKWTIKTSMNTSRNSLSAVTVNEKIYAIGGYDGKNQLDSYLNTVEEYTPSEISAPILTATSKDAKVNLSWNQVEGATSYNIKRSETVGAAYTQIGNVTTNAYTDTSVTGGKTYYYVVTAVTGTSESANSNEAAVNTSSIFNTHKP